ncbi:HIT family protein [Candidatus Dojkabacteria bacterium]|uniref:HIT family protein n=1 Tax=Candidatus Dojkabacteria bacterium TaxID=2099670 RepID=A0A955I6Q6_9BACT|nr:HIT family protein [Candidatus Dojkabacteria bacterium]
MSQTDCIFCKIIAGKLPSYKVYEDDDFVAFLDIFPSHYGQTAVVPKHHHPSKFSDADIDLLQRLIVTTQKVAKKLEKKLDAERCIIVAEGLELDHLHLKLYPALRPDPTSYVVSKPGKRADDKELQQILENITS